MIDPATFASAVTNAPSGAVLELSPGDYGDKTISKKTGLRLWAPNGGAMFNTLKVLSCSNVSLDALSTHMAFKDGVTVAEGKIIEITNSNNITISGGSIKGALALTGVDPSSTTLDATRNVIGLPSGHGIWAYNVNGLRVVGNDLSVCYRGIQALASSNVTIDDNDIHDTRKSLIACSVKDGFIVRRNHLYKATTWGFTGDFDHGDAITNWTWAAEGQNTKNELIEDNLFEARDGTNILGIYLMGHDGTYNWCHENAIIRRNVIITATYTGIYVERGISGAIQDNIVLMNPVRPAAMEPWVKISYENSQLITGNRLPRISWTTAPAGWLANINSTNSIGATKAGEAEAAIAAWLAKFRGAVPPPVVVTPPPPAPVPPPPPPPATVKPGKKRR